MAPAPEETGPEPPALSDDEAAFRASFALVVDWYRVSQVPTLLRAFAPTMLGFVPVGGALTALGSSARALPASLAPYATLAGVLTVAAGALWCGVTLVRSIRGDAYVAIRLDGLALRLDGAAHEELFAWRDIEDVRYDASADTAELVLRDRAERRFRGRFSEVSLEELTRRIRDARRLAVWQRLRPRAHAR